MGDVLRNVSGSPSFLHRLKVLLEQVDVFLKKINVRGSGWVRRFRKSEINEDSSFQQVPPEVLAQKTSWPAHLVR